jgi:hypothetical protein
MITFSGTAATAQQNGLERNANKDANSTLTNCPGWPADWVLTFGPNASAPYQPSGSCDWVLSKDTHLHWYAVNDTDYVQTGKARMVIQRDGNLVVYDENNKPRWSLDRLGVHLVAGSEAVFQRDGNLVVRAPGGGVVWASGVTCMDCGWRLRVQGDGNVVVYTAGWVPKWSTGTSH